MQVKHGSQKKNNQSILGLAVFCRGNNFLGINFWIYFEVYGIDYIGG
jgi:hypothetical protein